MVREKKGSKVREKGGLSRGKEEEQDREYASKSKTKAGQKLSSSSLGMRARSETVRLALVLRPGGIDGGGLVEYYL